MILTGKAKEAFLKHSIGKEIALFETMLPIYQHALIIEWLDSEDIFISVEFDYHTACFSARITTYEQPFDGTIIAVHIQPTRQQATEKAIERAVELFNERS